MQYYLCTINVGFSFFYFSTDIISVVGPGHWKDSRKDGAGWWLSTLYLKQAAAINYCSLFFFLWQSKQHYVWEKLMCLINSKLKETANKMNKIETTLKLERNAERQQKYKQVLAIKTLSISVLSDFSMWQIQPSLKEELTDSTFCTSDQRCWLFFRTNNTRLLRENISVIPCRWGRNVVNKKWTWLANIFTRLLHNALVRLETNYIYHRRRKTNIFHSCFKACIPSNPRLISRLKLWRFWLLVCERGTGESFGARSHRWEILDPSGHCTNRKWALRSVCATWGGGEVEAKVMTGLTKERTWLHSKVIPATVQREWADADLCSVEKRKYHTTSAAEIGSARSNNNNHGAADRCCRCAYRAFCWWW